MPHTFDGMPLYFGMTFLKLFCKFIGSLADNFKMFYKPKKCNWISDNFIVFILISKQYKGMGHKTKRSMLRSAGFDERL